MEFPSGGTGYVSRNPKNRFDWLHQCGTNTWQRQRYAAFWDMESGYILLRLGFLTVKSRE